MTEEQFLFTISGDRTIDLNCPDLSEVTLGDVTQRLALLPRWCGCSPWEDEYFSVLDHQTFVASLVPPEHRRQALFHDIQEMFLGGSGQDVPSPAKACFRAKAGSVWDDMEHDLLVAAAVQFNFSPTIHPLVKSADLAAMEYERHYLCDGPAPRPVLEGLARPDVGRFFSHPRRPPQARREWLEMYGETTLLDSPPIQPVAAPVVALFEGV